MKAIFTRGGTSQIQQIPSLKDFAIIVDSVKTPGLEIHPYRTQFINNSKMIIDNMFQEYTARRYLQGSTQKLKTIAPTYLAPIASNQINTTALVSWTFFGVILICFTTLGALYLFQRAERKRYQNKNDKVLIDITASFIDKQ